MRKKVIKISLLLFVVFLIYKGYETYRKLTIISGYTSKYVCSCVFGSGRELDDVLALDLADSPVSWAKHKIDYEKKTVTSTVWGKKPNTSIYREGFGCSLLADFSEEKVRSQTFPNLAEPVINTDTVLWPAGDQLILTKEEKALSKKIMNAIAPEFIETDDDLLKNTTAITVAYDGKLLAEKYRKGFTQNTPLLGWSMTKSISSTLVGMLVKEGKLNVHKPAPVPEWKNDKRSNITLHHLLQMTSGLEWKEVYTKLSPAVTMLYQKGDMYEYSIQSEYDEEAGTEWKYSSGTSNIISGIIRRQFESDEAYWRFPYEQLFYRVGMYSAIIEPDASGMFAGSSYGFATARDWTRYGLLYYNDGIWLGDTIVDPSWVAYTKTTSEVIPKGQYGVQWWLNKGKEGEYKLEGIPDDAFFCDGYQGQRVYVIPSKKLVVTRFGKTPGLDAFEEEAMLQRIFDCLPKN